jgi:signal transduction histidine kinase
MLRVLRETEHSESLEPAPGLERLQELVDRVCASGIAVRVQVEGSVRSLTPATNLAAYRTVQEALTNVIRHAPSASASVQVEYAADSVRIEVTDDGGLPQSGLASTLSGTGLGLSGLRERASALGGTLEAGPTSSQGFRVCVRLPIGSAG